MWPLLRERRYVIPARSWSSQRSSRLAALIVGTLIALSVAACGGSGRASSQQSAGSNSGGRIVRAAYTTTLRRGTAKFDFTTVTRARSATGSTEAAKVTGTGEGNFNNHDFKVMVNSPSGGSVQVLEIGAKQYTHVPPSQRLSVPGHKPWVLVDLNKVDEARLGRSFAQLSGVQNDNPSQVLSHLSQVSDRVTKVGSTSIAGVPTTAYKLEVDLRKVAAQAKQEAGGRAGQAVQQQAQVLGTHRLPVEVWIDGQHLVRQISEQVPIPAASSGASNGSGHATVTIRLSDYGLPVHFTPPPSSQVANITNQAVQQARAAAG
jgi:hypothetical protein